MVKKVIFISVLLIVVALFTFKKTANGVCGGSGCDPKDHYTCPHSDTLGYYCQVSSTDNNCGNCSLTTYGCVHNTTIQQRCIDGGASQCTITNDCGGAAASCNSSAGCTGGPTPTSPPPGTTVVPTNSPPGEKVNCKNLSISGGPFADNGDLFVNQSYTFSGDFHYKHSSGDTYDSTAWFMAKVGTGCTGVGGFQESQSLPLQPPGDKTKTKTWTFDTPGTYTVYCASISAGYGACSGDYQCDKRPGFADYACDGPTSSMTVNVVEPSTPTPTPGGYNYFDIPADNTTVVAGNAIGLEGWAYMCSSACGAGAGRVDLHFCDQNGLNCNSIAGDIPRKNRGDVANVCSAGNPGNSNTAGWIYTFTVPGNASGNHRIRAAQYVNGNTSCANWSQKDIIVITPTPTPTPLSATAWCTEAPTPVDYGGDATITLHSTNATSCTVWNNGSQIYSGSNTSGGYPDGPLTTPGNNQGKVECWNLAGVSSGQNTCNYTVSNPPPTPTPTLGPCQVTTSPAVLNLIVGDISPPVTASVTSGLGTATVTRMDFGSYSPAIASVNSTSDVVSPYSTTVTGVAPGNTAVWATATLSDTRICQTTGLTDTNVNVVKANSVPTVGTLVIKNSAGTPVSEETGSKNQICQTDFGGFKSVTFELTVNDLDGCTDLSTAQLRWNNHIYDLTLNNCVGTVTVDYTGVNDPDLLQIDGKVTDLSLATSDWVSTTRNWKVWNCNVSTSGNIYEIDQGNVCTNNSKIPATADLKFTGVNFHQISPSTEVFISSAGSPNVYSGDLTWGKGYIVSLPGINGDQPTGLGWTGADGNSVCNGSPQFTIGQVAVDAYPASPQIKIDIGSVMNQDPWWQALGGGVMAGNQISDRTPVTCVALCVPAIINELAVGDSSNGAALGQTIDNTGSWYSYPRNNYRIEMNGKGENTSYSALYNKLFSESGVGVTYSGGANWNQIMTDTGGTGVAFVNGDLLIDSDNTIDSGKFLMVVVKGSIGVSLPANNVAGVLVSDGNINIGETSNTALNINGIVYSNGDINIKRGYKNPMAGVNNNNDAAVKFNYRPDLLFNMPAAVSRALYNWRVGQ